MMEIAFRKEQDIGETTVTVKPEAEDSLLDSLCAHDHIGHVKKEAVESLHDLIYVEKTTTHETTPTSGELPFGMEIDGDLPPRATTNSSSPQVSLTNPNGRNVAQRSFQCDACDQGFSSKNQLTGHMTSHVQHFPPRFVFRPEKSGGEDNVKAQYGCTQCGKQYQLNKSLERHIKQCHASSSFFCEICSNRPTFRTSEELKFHSCTGSNEKEQRLSGEDCDNRSRLGTSFHHNNTQANFNCDSCDKVFYTKTQLIGHMSNHGKNLLHRLVFSQQALKSGKTLLPTDIRFGCMQCSKSYESKRSLRKHMWRHEDAIPSFICDVCNKAFHTKYQITNHLISHSIDRPFGCNICSQTFKYKTVLNKHLDVHTSERRFPCKECGKRYKSIRNLRQHEVTHKRKKVATCDVCGKLFGRKHTMLLHKRMRHPTEPIVKNFSCEHCSKCFSTLTFLKNHMLTHTKEKPFPCEICLKCFASKERLKRHFSVHSDVRHFRCEKCNKEFRTDSNLRQHMVCHSELRKFCCLVCDRKFKLPHQLRAHMVSHSGARPHSCQMCPKTFMSYGALSHHRKTHYK